MKEISVIIKIILLNYNYINIPSHALKELIMLKNVDLEHHGQLWMKQKYYITR